MCPENLCPSIEETLNVWGNMELYNDCVESLGFGILKEKPRIVLMVLMGIVLIDQNSALKEFGKYILKLIQGFQK